MGDRQHVDAQGILQLCLLIENVADFLDVSILFQFEDNADSLFVRLVGNVHNIGQSLVFYKLRNIDQEFIDAGADHGVWDLTDDKFISVTFPASQLHLDLTAQLNLSGSSFIDRRQIFFIGNDTSGRKIRPRHIFHHLFK